MLKIAVLTPVPSASVMTGDENESGVAPHPAQRVGDVLPELGEMLAWPDREERGDRIRPRHGRGRPRPVASRRCASNVCSMSRP